ncbi:MAG: glycoside hydrolase family 15 protein, partial [Bdellovibrionales bacterium]|nr:glycoside hydrolase family 15 protein [Bdellovibrionales bacterium]
ISYDLWVKLSRLIEFVCKNWQKPDSGIWEVRGGNREFLYSRVMCWVAIDRAVRLSLKRGLPAPLDVWIQNRNAIYKSVFNDFWNEKKKAFVQFKGAKALDASTLTMPLVRFISPKDPRWLSTLQAIEKELVHDSLVYRYNVGEAFSDCLDGQEGTFSICSFWFIESVSRSGNVQKARYLFEKMLGYANNLGLFSEQLGPRGEFLGNVPQAFTHLALISTAFDLDRRLSASGKRYY